MGPKKVRFLQKLKKPKNRCFLPFNQRHWKVHQFWFLCRCSRLDETRRTLKKWELEPCSTRRIEGAKIAIFQFAPSYPRPFFYPLKNLKKLSFAYTKSDKVLRSKSVRKIRFWDLHSQVRLGRGNSIRGDADVIGAEQCDPIVGK